MNSRLLAVSCTALLATANAQSGVPLALEPCVELTPAIARAKSFVLHPVLTGAAMHEHVERALQLPWQRTLDAAQAEARRRDRPILWVQALGDLEGFA